MSINDQRSTINPFLLLQEPPRPWLDPDALKAKFLKLSAPLHPDRVHHLSDAEKQEATRRFAELNAAHQTLRDPRERINLLLELETGAKPKDIQKIPPGTMDLFVEVGQCCRELDVFLVSRDSAETSPLLKVAAMQQQGEWLEKLQALQAKVDAKADAMTEELRQLDAEWISSPEHKPLLDRLENIARLFSYTARWSQQLGERLVVLKTR